MSDADRPERTREHCIDALGRNHFERFVFLQGHVAEEPKSDYGYDLVITTFDYKGNADLESGEVENGSVYVQLKSTDKLKKLKKDSTKISFTIKCRHIEYWKAEPLPVILVVYSVPDQIAYWLHMQPYLKSPKFVPSSRQQEEITVNLSSENIVDEEAIKTFRKYKSDILKRIEGLDLYGY